MEKEAILNSYKIFLKTCNFDIQILVHTNKKDLSKIISNIPENANKVISKKYIEFIQKINSEKKSSNKSFYIVIKENSDEDIFYKLNEKFFKIKECLNRCGNKVRECSREEILEIIYEFYNTRLNQNK